MKYRDLVSFETMAKLTQVSFSTPTKNLQMYRLAESLRTHQSYIENERNKLIRKYGEPTEGGNYAVKGKEAIDKFLFEFNETLDVDVQGEIECPNIKEEDFSDDNCSYPIDKSMWPNAKDIASFFEFCNELEKEKKNEKNGG